MPFLAGVIAAWSFIYAVLSVCGVVAYLRFGRNRDYLDFAAFCCFMGIYTAASTVYYLADDLEQAVMPGRVRLAVLPPAGIALLYLGLGRTALSRKTVRLLLFGTGSFALFLSGTCLAGLAVDYERPTHEQIGFFLGQAIVYKYKFSVFGYVDSIFSLGAATLGGALLGKGSQEDRVARNFFYLGVVTLNAIALNDILFANDIIRSVYLVEHGLFLMTLSVLIGLLREFELSRRELQDRTLELGRTSRRLDRAVDETRSLRPLADLGRLSASLAHEIRNPLAVLFNVASALGGRRGAERDPEQMDMLVAMLRQETEKLARLVDDLLLFSRSPRSSLRSLDVAQLVQSALSEVRDTLPLEMQVDIVTDIQPGIEPFLGSAGGMKRALANLISNAMQSSRGRGRVRVIARREPGPSGMLAIGVQDEAGGIPQESIAEIFEPFYSTRSTGAGLGLSIARIIIQAHGGTLELENRPGHGATFWMRLPVAGNRLPAEK